MSKPREIRLSTTPTPEAIAALRLGDIVYLDGIIYTAREGVYMRALEHKANIPMELPAQSAANFHCSPAAAIRSDGSFDMGAVTATASFRFAKWLPEWMAKTGARLIIGKGGMYGNVLRITPALTATPEQVEMALDILDHAFGEVQEGF